MASVDVEEDTVIEIVDAIAAPGRSLTMKAEAKGPSPESVAIRSVVTASYLAIGNTMLQEIMDADPNLGEQVLSAAVKIAKNNLLVVASTDVQ